jgi:hypothetical protein
VDAVVVGVVMATGTRRVDSRQWRICALSDLQPQRTRDSSVTIGPEWQMLEEIDFTRLYKLNLSVEDPEEL